MAESTVMLTNGSPHLSRFTPFSRTPTPAFSNLTRIPTHPFRLSASFTTSLSYTNNSHKNPIFLRSFKGLCTGSNDGGGGGGDGGNGGDGDGNGDGGGEGKGSLLAW